MLSKRVTRGVGLLASTLGVIIFSQVATKSISFAQVDKTIVDPAVEYLSDLRGISKEEAAKRAQWFNGASKLDGKIISNQVDGFGGTWINPDNDRIQVGISKNANNFSESKNQISILASEEGLDNVVDFISVQNSYERLLSVRQKIIEDFNQKLSGNTKGFAVGIETDKNKVILHTPENMSDISATEKMMVQSINNRFSSDVLATRVSTGEYTSFSCNWWFCDSPLRGGVGISGYVNSSYSPTGATNCTAGFGVRGNSGTKYILTAGHCATIPAPDWNYWRTNDYSYSNRNMGAVHRNVLSEGSKIDAMIIKTDDIGSWTAVGKVYVRAGIGLGNFSGPSTNEDYDITDHGTSGGLINDRVCTSGAKSSDLNYYEGGSCGPVKEILLYEPDGGDDVGPLDGLVRAYLCARHGDSGAPVFRSGVALGIISGGLDGEGCNENITYTGMSPIISAFNGTIDVY